MRCVTVVEKELRARARHMISSPVMGAQRPARGRRRRVPITKGPERYMSPYHPELAFSLRISWDWDGTIANCPYGTGDSQAVFAKGDRKGKGERTHHRTRSNDGNVLRARKRLMVGVVLLEDAKSERKSCVPVQSNSLVASSPFKDETLFEASD
jgi:hypothetical protein